MDEVPLYVSDPEHYEKHSACKGLGYRVEYRDGKQKEIHCSLCQGGSVPRKRVASTPITELDPIIDPILRPRSIEEIKQAYERGLAEGRDVTPKLLHAIELSPVLSSQQKYDARLVIENGNLADDRTYTMLEKIRANWAGVVQPNGNLMQLLDSYKTACWDVCQNKGRF
jgi:hypothetical protein